MRSLWDRFIAVENVVHAFLVRYSIMLLRVALGAVFLGFGILKFFPGISPAENLAEATSHILFLGVVPGGVAIVLIAALECTIGLLLISGRGMRVASYLLVGEFLGILSPIVLLPSRLFAGPHGAPTLEGQYVIKDITLVAAAMVVAAASFRGGRLVRQEPAPPQIRSIRSPHTAGADHRLDIVLSAIGGGQSVEAVCRAHGISEGTYHEWRDRALSAAAQSLDAPVHSANGAGAPA